MALRPSGISRLLLPARPATSCRTATGARALPVLRSGSTGSARRLPGLGRLHVQPRRTVFHHYHGARSRGPGTPSSRHGPWTRTTPPRRGFVVGTVAIPAGRAIVVGGAAAAAAAAGAIAHQASKVMARIEPDAGDGDSSPTHVPISTLRAIIPQKRVNKQPTFLGKCRKVVMVVLRSLRLLCTFTPVVFSYPLALLVSRWRAGAMELWWNYALWTVEMSGPAFIKFAQWASTRPDIFPARFCELCSRLHDRVRPHTFADTERTLRLTFGDDWRSKLEIEDQPVGTGCVAQVYKGFLKDDQEGAADTTVAVKVIHPHVRTTVMRDLDIMRFIAGAAELVPYLRWMSLADGVEEFAQVMHRQIDLTIEGSNLSTFNDNFHGSETVQFPIPITQTENVLIETFEQGVPITQLFSADITTRRVLANTGVDLFLKMVFDDNFVHGDLHPGNIFVSGVSPTGEMLDDVKLVVLDAGIVTKLQPQDRKNFVDLFREIVRRDGHRAGELLIERATKQECEDPERFCQEIDKLVQDATARNIRLGEVRIGDLLSRVMGLACDYRVRVESNFASIVIGIMVLEGLGRRLDPSLDLLAKAAPKLLKDAIVL